MTDMSTGQQHVRLGSNAGQPMTRRDGVLKVTGQAPYAADLRSPRSPRRGPRSTTISPARATSSVSPMRTWCWSTA